MQFLKRKNDNVVVPWSLALSVNPAFDSCTEAEAKVLMAAKARKDRERAAGIAEHGDIDQAPKTPQVKPETPPNVPPNAEPSIPKDPKFEPEVPIVDQVKQMDVDGLRTFAAQHKLPIPEHAGEKDLRKMILEAFGETA